FRKSVWSLPNEIRKEPALTKQSHLDEERRLLYVGMTRARKQLTLTAIEKKGTRPSTFLKDDLLNSGLDSSVIKIIDHHKEKLAPDICLQKPRPFERTSRLDASGSGSADIKPLQLSYTQLST